MTIRKQALLLTLLAVLSMGTPGILMGASLPEGGPRKQIKNDPPAYPELARRMNISGTVRLELDVATDGTVKNVKALGGNPVLIDSAMKAARQWTYEPGQASTVVVAVKFENSQ